MGAHLSGGGSRITSVASVDHRDLGDCSGAEDSGVRVVHLVGRSGAARHRREVLPFR